MSELAVRSFADVEKLLTPYVAAAANTMHENITTERTLALSQAVGSPHEKLRVIHTAGTSGKTSTSYYIADLLHRSGKTTGLTVSPHIDSVAERVQINGKPLAEAEFCELLAGFDTLVQKIDLAPTYFEYLLVFALWVFARYELDYAVLETGLGGLHDSTNICQRSDKMSVLTDIGLDHMHILGTTIPEITAQKAGIIAPGSVVLMHEQSAEIMNEVQARVSEQQATLLLTKPDVGYVMQPELPLFQGRNWRLAIAAYEYIAQRDELRKITNEEALQSQRIEIPGRMNILQLHGKTIVLDGAHNEQKMRALLESFRQQFPDQKPLVVLALKQGKELASLAPQIAAIAEHVIVTSFTRLTDTPIGVQLPQAIADELDTYGVSTSVQQNSKDAWEEVLGSDAQLVLITGSLYLVAEIRSYLQ